VRPAARAEAPPVQAEHGHTMVYSTSDRHQEELRADGPDFARPASRRAMVLADGKRIVLGADGAVLGRSRDCDVVLADQNVSRHHAELRPDGRGGWRVRDLGSTNGTKRNGRPVSGTEPVEDGDRLLLGTADLRFVLD
jgi:pSer/pThr/pTyr-binding forkhead associated (FHA) protein